MTKLAMMLVMPVALIGLQVGGALSQCPMMMHHERAAQPYSMSFDPQAIETLAGEVLRVDTITPTPGMAAGVHLVVETADGERLVHLGPAWYLEHQEQQIAPGDEVTITVSRVRRQGAEMLVAVRIQMGEDVLVLRNDRGQPMWAGWRRRM